MRSLSSKADELCMHLVGHCLGVIRWFQLTVTHSICMLCEAGLKVKFHTMKAGTGGPVVGIRFCQELA
jgi:hypothetical protein